MFFSFNRHSSNLKKVIIHLENCKRWIGIQGAYSFKYFSLFSAVTAIATAHQLYIFSDYKQAPKKTINVVQRRFERALRGVKLGFSIKIRAIGVGYRLNFNKGRQELVLKLGHSHTINKSTLRGMFFKRLNDRSSIYLTYFDDKQQLNNFVAEIKSLRPVEPYKGKGLRYMEEITHRKEGKKSNL